jgi:hypothetical protein
MSHKTTVERSEPGASVATVEVALRYVDRGPDGTEGASITVEWSEEDGCWIARLTGCNAGDPTIGHGDTKEEALCSLACSLACLADACHGLWQEAEGTLAETRRQLAMREDGK